MFLIQINNIHHYIINISLQKILLYNIKLNIPSLFNGSKSLDIVENVESLPNVGSPALWQNKQFAIVQSPHPVPVA